MSFAILDHTADLRIKVSATSIIDLFKEAAEGMYQAVCGQEFRSLPKKDQTKDIKVEGEDYESLLVNFLNDLLYLSDVENKGFEVCDLRIQKKRKMELKARLFSYPLTALEVEIKGATHHNLKIKKRGKLYEAVVVFDI